MDTPNGYIFNGLVSEEPMEKMRASRPDADRYGDDEQTVYRDYNEQVAAVGASAVSGLEQTLQDVRWVIDKFTKIDYAAPTADGARKMRLNLAGMLYELADGARDNLYAAARKLEEDASAKGYPPAGERK